MAKPITVSIVGNAGPLKKSLDEADGALGKFGGAVQKLGLAAAAGVGALAAGIGFAAKQAADDQKSFEQLAVTMRNVTGASEEMVKSIDDQLGAMSLATGVADDKLRPAYEALIRGTKDAETALRDMTLVLDISTALQTDQTTIADALAKAYEGNFKALRNLSPEMATMIKEGASLEEVMKVLGDTFGGSAAAAAGTFSGQVDRLKVFLGELVEQVGYYVLPVLSKIAEFIVEDVVPAFQKLVDKYGPALAAIFEKIAIFIGDKVVPVIRDRLLPFIQQVAEFIGEKLVPVIRDVAIKVFDGLRQIFEKVSDKIQENSGNIQKMRDFFGDLIKFVTTYVAPTLTKVLGVAFDVVGKAIGPVIDVVFTFMGALSSLGSFVLKIAGFLVGTFEKAVNGIIDVVNFAIRQANKLNPFSDIPEIGKVSISSSFGAAPSAPSAPGAAVPDRLDRMESGASSMPSFTIPPVGGGTSTGGGGGGGGGGGAATSPFDPSAYDAKNRFYTMPAELSSAYGAKSRFYEIPSALDAAYAPKQAIYNVTVNTVTADANLPNLVVEALQTYNLVSGPLDVQIAV
jgi:hypothetical protein